MYFSCVLRQTHTRGEIKGQTGGALKQSNETQTWSIALQLSYAGTYSTLSASFKGAAEGK